MNIDNDIFDNLIVMEDNESLIRRNYESRKKPNSMPKLWRRNRH